jgi:hypothetical protein
MFVCPEIIKKRNFANSNYNTIFIFDILWLLHLYLLRNVKNLRNSGWKMVLWKITNCYIFEKCWIPQQKKMWKFNLHTTQTTNNKKEKKKKYGKILEQTLNKIYISIYTTFFFLHYFALFLHFSMLGFLLYKIFSSKILYAHTCT